MLNKSKKFLSFVLVAVFCTFSVFSAYASVPNDKIEAYGDIYEKGYKENVTIDGVVYTYIYSKDSSGNNVIKIESVNGKDEVVADAKTGIIYLNGSKVGNQSIYVESANESTGLSLKADSWKKLGSGRKYISWAEGTAAAVVGAIIATASGIAVGAAVAGAAAFAAACSGGTLYWTKWYSNGTRPKLKTKWYFRANTKEKYGPYTYTIAR